MTSVLHHLFVIATLIAVIDCQIWTQAHCNSQKTNNLPASDRQTLSCQPTYDWIRNDMNSGYLFGTIHGQPIIGNNNAVLYIRGQKFLRSLDIESNSINWEIGGSNYFSPPILSNDAKVVYSFLNVSFVQAFSAGNGQSMGIANVTVRLTPLGIPEMITQNSLLYLAYYQLGAPTALFQFSTFPLALNWHISGSYNCITLGSDSTLYTSSGTNTSVISAISPNGTTLWSSAVINDGILTIVIRPDNSILASGNHLHILSPQGTLLKTINNQNILAVFSDSSMLTSEVTTVLKLNSDGEQDWLYINNDFNSVTGASIDVDLVYISYTAQGSGPYVVAVNGSSGEPMWQVQITDQDSSTDIDTPVIVGDGSLLVRIGPNIHRLTSCSSRGECNGDLCDCVSDWFSSNCSIYCNETQCAASTHGHGACGDLGCTCDQNYFPADTCAVFCNISECSEITKNKGFCSALGCVCTENYFGDDCQNLCDKGLVTNGTCACFSSYYGETCDVYCDPTETCSGNGECNENGVCVCNSGYNGDSCDAMEHDHSDIGLILGLTFGGVAIVAVVVAIYLVRRKKRLGYEPIGQN